MYLQLCFKSSLLALVLLFLIVIVAVVVFVVSIAITITITTARFSRREERGMKPLAVAAQRFNNPSASL